MADTGQIIKTNSYGFFGYVVPGVVVVFYLTTVVSYLQFDDPLHVLRVLHQVVPTDDPAVARSFVPNPYEYISFLLVFVVAAYIAGHLAEACANMIYDRFYMRRIYGHRLRQLILDEGTDRKETHKNFYRAAIAAIYLAAFVYLLAVFLRGRGFAGTFWPNVGWALGLAVVLGSAIAWHWHREGPARKQEEKARDFLKDCELIQTVVDDLSRKEEISAEQQDRLDGLGSLWSRIRGDDHWAAWGVADGDPLQTDLGEAAAFLAAENYYDAKDSLAKAGERLKVLKARNTGTVKVFASLSRLAELVTRKVIDDERPISKQLKRRFHAGFRKVLEMECRPSLGSEVNRLPMWYVVETQKDLSSFIVKYRAQAAMMCNISGAFLLCTLISIFAFQGHDRDKDFAFVGMATLVLSMFTSLRYFHVHDNDYVKTLIYAFVIGTTKPETDVAEDASAQ